MKVKVDENLPGEVADLFRAAGHEAETVVEERLGGIPDPVLSRIVRQEDRLLITLDLGFADIRAYPPERYAGLLVLRLRRQDKPHVLEVISRLMVPLAAEDPRGHLWIVEEQRVRIRPRD